ncbi:MAG: helix-turn-helix transcriptional regulator [Sphingomonadales bacterium]
MVHSRIREIRKNKGLTLQDVADRAGTTAQTIGRLETGTRTLSLKWINRISKALEVEGATLLALPEQGDIEIFGEINRTGLISKKSNGTVSARLFAKEPTAISIKENLGPYMAGDVLIFEKNSKGEKNFLGKECLVQHKNGTYYFALVLGGTNDKTFSLAPVGKKAGILENQEIASASPIVALVRKFD